jgi:hypothetical protein
MKKYYNGILTILLLTTMTTYTHKPIIPQIIKDLLIKYSFLSHLLIILLGYMLTHDLNVAILCAFVIKVMQLITCKLDKLTEHPVIIDNTETSKDIIIQDKFKYLELDNNK